MEGVWITDVKWDARHPPPNRLPFCHLLRSSILFPWSPREDELSSLESLSRSLANQIGNDPSSSSRVHHVAKGQYELGRSSTAFLAGPRPPCFCTTAHFFILLFSSFFSLLLPSETKEYLPPAYSFPSQGEPGSDLYPPQRWYEASSSPPRTSPSHVSRSIFSDPLFNIQGT